MLVLSRKIGQQLVLPEHGIIIDVVDVGKTRVRLGVTAPSNITVHRGEIRDRAAATDNAPPASGDSPPEVPAADGSTNAKPHSPSSADLGPCLALWIAKRTGGRVRGLSVETYQDRIVIRGSRGLSTPANWRRPPCKRFSTAATVFRNARSSMVSMSPTRNGLLDHRRCALGGSR